MWACVRLLVVLFCEYPGQYIYLVFFLKYFGYMVFDCDCPSKYNFTVELNDSSIIVQLSSNVLFIIVFMFVTCTPVRGFGQNKKTLKLSRRRKQIVTTEMSGSVFCRIYRV